MARYHPLAEGTGTLSSGYGPRWGTHHNGQDYAAPLGTPIYAVADGTIIEGRDRAPGTVTGFGNWVWQDSQATCGKDFIYGHMRHADILVRKGDRVKAGQLIARVGNEGQSTGPHLHFEVWGAPGRIGGKHENPTTWLKTATWLKPTSSPQPERSSMNAIKADIDLLTNNDDGRATKKRNLLCVHTFEDDGNWTADKMARYQQQPSAGGSYHMVIDKTGRIARENDDAFIPWSAMYTGNRVAYHFSLSGKAAWTRQQWLARPAQLDALARILAAYSKKYGIPLIRRNPQEVRAGKWGVCGHDDISKAFKESTHWDPGTGFPFDVVIDKAVKILSGPAKPAQPADPAPKPIPPKETLMPTTLDSVLPSLVAGSTFEAPLATFIRTADKQAYEANQRIARLEAKVDRLLEASGVKPESQPGE